MSKRVNLKHILVFCAYEALAAVLYGFGAFVLKERGFDYGVIGICIGISNCHCFTLLPFISNKLDNSEKYSIFDACFIISIIVFTLALANYFLKTASIITAIVFTIEMMLFSMMEPFTNALNFPFNENGVECKYGTARAIGSASYGIMCAMLGVVSENAPYRIILFAAIVFAILLIFSLFTLRKDYTSLNVQKNREKIEDISFIQFVKGHKSFIVLCLFLVGVYFSYLGIDNFTLKIVESVGGTSKDMGVILGIKAAFEVPSIFFYDRFEKRFGTDRLIKVAAIFFVVKNLIYLLAKNVAIIYACQILQALSFALLYPAMVSYVHSKMSVKESIRGQSSFSTAICIASIASSVIDGFVIENYGVSAMLALSLVIASIGMIGILVMVEKNKSH